MSDIEIEREACGYLGDSDTWDDLERDYRYSNDFDYDYFADEDYAMNMPCDNSGMCAGHDCSRYWECHK